MQRHFAKQSQFTMARFRNNPEASCWAIAHLHGRTSRLGAKAGQHSRSAMRCQSEHDERRPAHVIEAAIMVLQIVTGEIESADGKFYLDCFDR
jgi:hypothetical protein